MKYLYLLFLLSVIADRASATTVSTPVFTKPGYELYEKAEATFTLSQTYNNPYDPAVVKVDAIITQPDHSTLSIPCFYYTPVTFTNTGSTTWDATENTGNSIWMLRFAPTQAGTYSIKIQVSDGSTTTSSAATITAVNSARKGFIHMDATNQQFARHETGEPYYPVGFDLAWNDGTLTGFYQSYLDKMAPNKVTWMRYWLTDFARQALEWSSSQWSGWYQGVGKYSQQASFVLDSVLQMCETRGIYLQLVLQHHGQFSTTVNSEWSGNPYNTANGGPCDSAGHFFTNSSAKVFSKNQYRYIIARWGYSPNIVGWELFNEVNFTDGTPTNIDTWHDEMSQYIDSIDVYHHIITTSTSSDLSLLQLMDNNAKMNQLQFHVYSAHIETALYETSRNYLSSLSKPIWCGEFGTNDNYTNHPDKWGDHVRKSTWIGMFSKVPNMFWYWDTYINANNLYSLYAPLGDFLNGVDIVAETGGDYTNFTFSSNDYSNSSAVAVPGLSWATSMQDTFTVQPDGSVPGIANLSVYLQGSYHTAMGTQASFTATFSSAGTVVMDVAGVSTSTSSQSLDIYVDGALTSSNTLTGATQITTSVTAGRHTIKYVNTGLDWIQANSYTFSPIQVPEAAAYGYIGADRAYGYVYNKAYGDWANPDTIIPLSGVSLKIGSLTAGSYDVSFTDPVSGVVTIGNAVTSLNDSVIINLPDFKKDIAFKLSPSVVTLINNSVSNYSFSLYPNPTTGTVTLSLSDSDLNSDYQIINNLGLEVLRGKAEARQTHVDLSDYPSGIYYIRAGKDHNTVKFVKQ